MFFLPPHKLDAIHRNIDFGSCHLGIRKTNRKRRMQLKNWRPLLTLALPCLGWIESAQAQTLTITGTKANGSSFEQKVLPDETRLNFYNLRLTEFHSQRLDEFNPIISRQQSSNLAHFAQ